MSWASHGFFSGLCYRCCGLEPRLCVGLKSLLRQGLLEPAFYGDLVYKLKLEDLKVLRRSPDLLNNDKIGQG